MPTIHYKALEAYIQERDNTRFAPVFLIFGEEMLCRTALETLVHAFIPESARASNYEPMEGLSENITEAIERVNTFSLFAGKKIVALLDTRLFYSRQDEKKFLEKIRQAYESENIEKAAKQLLNMLTLFDLSLEDISAANRGKTLKKATDVISGGRWLDEVVAFCHEKGFTVPGYTWVDQILQKAIEKGFPAGNHLIITTDVVDKRKKLYKSIKDHGVIIDCAIPRGMLKADRTVQEGVMKEKTREILSRHQKQMDLEAYRSMYEKIGFDLRLLSNSLDKLIDFAGARKKITVADVEKVLKRSKRDPIFEFTNAITDRHLDTSLFYLDSLLGSGEIEHPLQLLAALINQIRKLLLVKDFIENLNGKDWYPECPYPNFQKKVMPAIIAYDHEWQNRLEEWRGKTARPKTTNEKKSQKTKRPKTDLMIAGKSKSAFPVFKLFQKSEKFNSGELINLLRLMGEADNRLKSSGQNARMILENVIFKICMGG